MKLALSNTEEPGSTPDPLANRASNRLVRDVGLFVAGAGLYWFLVSSFSWFHGVNIVRLSPFFVGAAGYFLGVRAGTLASIVAICAHMIVFHDVDQSGPSAVFKHYPAVTAGIVLLGPMTGLLRTRLQRAVEALEEGRDQRARDGSDAPAESRREQTGFRDGPAGRAAGGGGVVPAGSASLETPPAVRNMDDAIRRPPGEFGDGTDRGDWGDGRIGSSGVGVDAALVAGGDTDSRRRISEQLLSRGFEVITAGDGREAIDAFESRVDPPGLLITDAVLPDGTGRELASRLRSRVPALKVLYISGYIGAASVKVTELGPGTSFISKPFKTESLARKIRLLLDTPAPVGQDFQPRTRSLHRPAR